MKHWMKIIRLGVLTTGLLGLVLQVPVLDVNAKPVNVARAHSILTFQGVNTDTGGLVWEGTRVGDIPGDVVVEVIITGETGAVVHFDSTWIVLTEQGETISGKNVGVLSISSLHFGEHGVVLTATGELVDYVGNLMIIQGQLSDLYYIPGASYISVASTIVPSNRY